MHPDRIAIGAFDDDDGDAVATLYASIEAKVVRSRCELGRDDQARGQCVPDDAHLVHQRDRERVRGRPAPTSSRSPRESVSTTASARTS